MSHATVYLKGNTAISLWLLLAMLFILPMLKYQHVAEHAFEISNNTATYSVLSETNTKNKYQVDNDCRICFSAALQQFINTVALLTFTYIFASEMVAVFFKIFSLSHITKYFSSRAPPVYLQ